MSSLLRHAAEGRAVCRSAPQPQEGGQQDQGEEGAATHAADDDGCPLYTTDAADQPVRGRFLGPRVDTHK